MTEIEMPAPSQGWVGVQVVGGHRSAPPPSCQLIFHSSQFPSKMEKTVQRGKSWRTGLLKLINRGHLPPRWCGYLHKCSSVPRGGNDDLYRINQISPTHRKHKSKCSLCMRIIPDNFSNSFALNSLLLVINCPCWMLNQQVFGGTSQ